MDNDLTAWLAAWRQWQGRAVADLRPRWAVNDQTMFDLELTPSELERAGAPLGPGQTVRLDVEPSRHPRRDALLVRDLRTPRRSLTARSLANG